MNEIIIEDVDVSECQYLALNRQKLTDDNLLVKIPHYCDAENMQCECNNCYYKQLQKQLKKNKELVYIIEKGQSKVTELKKEIDKLKSEIIFKYHGIL